METEKTTDKQNEIVLKFIPLAEKIAWDFNKKTPQCVQIDELKSAAYLGLIVAANKYDPILGSFPTYARIKILGSIKDYLRELNWGQRSNPISVLSLDMPVNEDSSLLETMVDDKKDSNIQGMIIEGLKDLEKEVMIMYYISRFTLKEIGRKLKVSESRVSQMLGASRESIRRRLVS